MESILPTTLSLDHYYQSAEPRAKKVIGALSGCIVMEVLSGVFGAGFIFGGSELIVDSGLSFYTTAFLFVALGRGLMYLAAMILFMMWFHHLYKNLIPLGATGLQYSPGWTIGAWFIPIGNLFIPYRIAKEIWIKSGERNEEYAFLNTESTVPGVIGTWWFFWVISNVSFQFGGKFGSALSDKFGLLLMMLLANAVTILAAVCAMRMIKMMTDRQEENIAQIPNYGAPPPPPTY